MTPIEQLESVLCDPTGKCCITGSDEDRAIVDRALKELTAQRQWVGLTDEDKKGFWTADQMTNKEWSDLFTAIESKLREKNT